MYDGTIRQQEHQNHFHGVKSGGPNSHLLNHSIRKVEAVFEAAKREEAELLLFPSAQLARNPYQPQQHQHRRGDDSRHEVTLTSTNLRSSGATHPKPKAAGGSSVVLEHPAHFASQLRKSSPSPTASSSFSLKRGPAGQGRNLRKAAAMNVMDSAEGGTSITSKERFAASSASVPFHHADVDGLQKRVEALKHAAAETNSSIERSRYTNPLPLMPEVPPEAPPTARNAIHLKPPPPPHNTLLHHHYHQQHAPQKSRHHPLHIVHTGTPKSASQMYGFGYTTYSFEGGSGEGGGGRGDDDGGDDGGGGRGEGGGDTRGPQPAFHTPTVNSRRREEVGGGGVSKVMEGEHRDQQQRQPQASNQRRQSVQEFIDQQQSEQLIAQPTDDYRHDEQQKRQQLQQQQQQNEAVRMRQRILETDAALRAAHGIAYGCGATAIQVDALVAALASAMVLLQDYQQKESS